ncbi:hypothetical protein [Ruegeria sp. HKCCD8929]|uniref:hypothetical protein n=1 Tax=Ruegeria sp. HKCCD8929 TaxID=2683006 RepID=UPI0014895A73|nr:hypothetical protein [Ruegeria sp. HKCCD8929]
MTEEVPQGVIDALKNDIQKEVSKKVAGWAVAGGAGLVVLAAIGAWALLKPQIASQLGVVQQVVIQDMIKAGSIREAIPKGAILAFEGLADCPDGWSEFESAAGKFLFGASDKGRIKFEVGATGQSELFLASSGGSIDMVGNGDINDYRGFGVTYRHTPNRGRFGKLVALTAKPDDEIGGDSDLQRGGGKSVVAMPPFVAVMFCVKHG